MTKTTFAGRVPSFYGLGHVFTDDVSTSEMLRLAELSNWNVRKVKMDDLAPLDYKSNSNLYVTVRDTDTLPQIIGAVRERYTVVQNEDAFAWADGILDGGGRWDTAGSFNSSTKVFGSLAIDRGTISVDPQGLNDKVDLYLLVSNSHDGSLPLQASITPVRVRCMNTLNLALKEAKLSTVPQTFKVRHTASAELRTQTAREALHLSFKYMHDFNTLANRMYQTPVSETDWVRILDRLYPKPTDTEENKMAMTRWTRTIDLIHDIRLSDNNKDIMNNAWGAMNTLTERIDWFRRGNDDTKNAIAASGFSPDVNARKNDIMQAVIHTVGV